jgi:hypothetical protein
VPVGGACGCGASVADVCIDACRLITGNLLPQVVWSHGDGQPHPAWQLVLPVLDPSQRVSTLRSASGHLPFVLSSGYLGAAVGLLSSLYEPRP